MATSGKISKERERLKEMEDYYKAFDHYKGSICMLTFVHCEKDCTKCVFAGEAYRQSQEERKEVKE